LAFISDTLEPKKKKRRINTGAAFCVCFFASIRAETSRVFPDREFYDIIIFSL